MHACSGIIGCVCHCSICCITLCVNFSRLWHFAELWHSPSLIISFSYSFQQASAPAEASNGDAGPKQNGVELTSNVSKSVISVTVDEPEDRVPSPKLTNGKATPNRKLSSKGGAFTLRSSLSEPYPGTVDNTEFSNSKQPMANIPLNRSKSTNQSPVVAMETSGDLSASEEKIDFSAARNMFETKPRKNPTPKEKLKENGSNGTHVAPSNGNHVAPVLPTSASKVKARATVITPQPKNTKPAPWQQQLRKLATNDFQVSMASQNTHSNPTPRQHLAPPPSVGATKRSTSYDQPPSVNHVQMRQMSLQEPKVQQVVKSEPSIKQKAKETPANSGGSFTKQGKDMFNVLWVLAQLSKFLHGAWSYVLWCMDALLDCVILCNCIQFS